MSETNQLTLNFDVETEISKLNFEARSEEQDKLSRNIVSLSAAIINREVGAQAAKNLRIIQLSQHLHALLKDDV